MILRGCDGLSLRRGRRLMITSGPWRACVAHLWPLTPLSLRRRAPPSSRWYPIPTLSTCHRLRTVGRGLGLDTHEFLLNIQRHFSTDMTVFLPEHELIMLCNVCEYQTVLQLANVLKRLVVQYNIRASSVVYWLPSRFCFQGFPGSISGSAYGFSDHFYPNIPLK